MISIIQLYITSSYYSYFCTFWNIFCSIQSYFLCT
jgi:hypothetical protein